jgi:hypothetical protein
MDWSENRRTVRLRPPLPGSRLPHHPRNDVINYYECVYLRPRHPNVVYCKKLFNDGHRRVQLFFFLRLDNKPAQYDRNNDKNHSYKESTVISMH